MCVCVFFDKTESTIFILRHTVKMLDLLSFVLNSKKSNSCFSDKSKELSGAVFGVPLSCCVETTSRKRSSQLETCLNDENSPTAKATRSNSRTSISSVADALRERVRSEI